MKWLHVLVIFYLALNCLGSINDLFWLFRNKAELGSSLNSSCMSCVVSIAAHVLSCLSGLTFPFICGKLAKRKKEILPWFFVAFTVNFLSLIYMMISEGRGKHSMMSIELSIIVLSVLFLFCVGFYLNKSVRRSIFGSN